MKRAAGLFLVWVILACTILPLFNSKSEAAFLTQRTVSVGTTVAGANTTHTIKLSVTTITNIGSMIFEYCSNSPLLSEVCIAPPGLSLSSASLISQTGETGFSIHPSSTVNKIMLTRTPVTTSPGLSQYIFSNVTNPTTANTTTYVRMSTYGPADATDAMIDFGGAAFATAGNFGAAAYVPPLLYFCAGLTVANNCNTYSGTSTSFGELSPTQVRYVTTQAAAATNDPTGYRIYILGTTMTSGNNTIPASSSPYPSVAGIGQFGINLRANNNPSTGLDISGAGVGSVTSNYNNPDQYMFESGALIAQATAASDFNTYTTTYIVNIPPTQAAGVYVATMTYLAIAQF